MEKNPEFGSGLNYIKWIVENGNVEFGSKSSDTTTIKISEQSEIRARWRTTLISYEGKTASTVTVGDLVTIGNEEFYVIKNDNNRLTLLAKYNLNVGNNSKGPATGIQDSEVIGYANYYDANIDQFVESNFGIVPFYSDLPGYWTDHIGEDYSGEYCEYSDPYECDFENTEFPYVYDSNSELYEYIEYYGSYIESLGVTVYESRLLKLEEAINLGCSYQGQCDNYDFINNTSFWLGTAFDNETVFVVLLNGGIDIYGIVSEDDAGVRPVIVISTVS